MKACQAKAISTGTIIGTVTGTVTGTVQLPIQLLDTVDLRDYTSSTGTSISSRLYTVECSRVSLQMQLSAVQLGERMWRVRVLALHKLEEGH